MPAYESNDSKKLIADNSDNQIRDKPPSESVKFDGQPRMIESRQGPSPKAGGVETP